MNNNEINTNEQVNQPVELQVPVQPVEQVAPAAPEVQVTQIPAEAPKKKGSNNVLLIVLLLIILLAGAGCAYYFLIVKQQKSDSNNAGGENTTIEKYTGKVLYNCSYEYTDGNYTRKSIRYLDDEKYCTDMDRNKIEGKGYINCRSNNECKMVDSTQDYVLINDGGTFSLYDDKNNLVKHDIGNITNANSEYFYQNKSGSLIILYTKKGSYDGLNVYNITKDKNGTCDYDGSSYHEDSLMYYTDYIDDENGLYNTETGEVNKNFNSHELYEYATIEGKEFIVGSDNNSFKIYDMNGNLLSTKQGKYYYTNDNIYNLVNKNLYKLDSNLNNQKSISDVDEIYEYYYPKDVIVLLKGDKRIVTDNDFNEYFTVISDSKNSLSVFMDEKAIYLGVGIEDSYDENGNMRNKYPALKCDEDCYYGYLYEYNKSTKVVTKYATDDIRFVNANRAKVDE